MKKRRWTNVVCREVQTQLSNFQGRFPEKFRAWGHSISGKESLSVIRCLCWGGHMTRFKNGSLRGRPIGFTIIHTKSGLALDFVARSFAVSMRILRRVNTLVDWSKEDDQIRSFFRQYPARMAQLLKILTDTDPDPGSKDPLKSRTRRRCSFVG